MIHTAIILAGGKGTRLPVSAALIPKALVEVRGKPILERQLDGLFEAGIRDVRLALGFRADQIIGFVRSRGYPVSWSVEKEPLGTGGAVRGAAAGLRDPFIVMNGDVIADFDYSEIRTATAAGEAALTGYWKDDARDFGLMDVAGPFVKAFREKPAEPAGGYINAGCYAFDPAHFEAAPDGFFMLEKDILPALALQGRLRAVIHRGFWEDLGTEERLRRVRSAAANPV